MWAMPNTWNMLVVTAMVEVYRMTASELFATRRPKWDRVAGGLRTFGGTKTTTKTTTRKWSEGKV